MGLNFSMQFSIAEMIFKIRQKDFRLGMEGAGAGAGGRVGRLSVGGV